MIAQRRLCLLNRNVVLGRIGHVAMGSAAAVAAERGHLNGPADEPEDRAIQVIKKLGGRFTRDDKAAAKPVVAVTLSGSEVTDATLKEIKGLTSLDTLQLILTHVTECRVEGA